MADAYGDRPGPGAVIGPYVVDSVLGSGGMGRVLSAVSPTGRRVAVKVIREEYAADPRFQARFAREVEAARRVSGAYTASVVDAATEGPLLWMATLFVPGPSLADRVVEGGPLPEREVRVLAYELAEALRDIHRVGLVHRDLKPGNILLSDDGPRVIDFGIARAEGTDRLTHTDAWVGTPAFMAPEQFLAQSETGPASDVFALGGVLTYALNGHGPFGGDSPYAIAWNVVHEDPAPVSGEGPLHELIGRCLSKDPAARPTPTQILDLLRETAIQPPDPAPPKESGPLAQQEAADSSPFGPGHTAPGGPAADRVTQDTETAASNDAGRATSGDGEEDSGDAAVPGPVESEEPHVEVGDRRTRTRTALIAGTLAAFLALGLTVWQPWRTGDGKESGKGAPTASGAAPQAPVAAAWKTKVPSGSGYCTSTEKVVLCEAKKEAVAAYDARTGKRLWGSTRTRDRSVLLAVSVERSLVVLAEGNNSIGPGEWNRQVLRAVDLTTGKERWNIRTIMGDSAAVSGTDLVVGGAFGITGRDLGTGAEKWGRTDPGLDGSNPAIRAGVVMNLRVGGPTGRPQGVLERLDPGTGAVRWSRDLPGREVYWAWQSERNSAGVEVLSDDALRIKEFLRFDASGTQTGRHKINTGESVAGAPQLAVYGPTWKVMRDRTKGRLIATTLAGGKPKWDLPMPAADGDPFVDRKGRVYVRRAAGQVLCLDGTSGRELWRSAPAQAGGSKEASVTGARLTVRADGVVFAYTGLDFLAAFKPPDYKGTAL
ncbi:protein kinase domain-containing protein [Streptomyces stackebrandtii]|uniref:serine/threonine-protein kinase n=1 Tax=Streptomyces stackebrandtii TaxID=3051177 RepID=UPI0028DD3AC3|nr:protein kinase [Streptomyces sp. DSM 40976]